MKCYYFTGHLSPLPPGVKLPLQISGDVYLADDVEKWQREVKGRYQAEYTRFVTRIAKLEAIVEKQKRTIKKLRGLKSGAQR